MIKIQVAATSANLGAGFDCMGLALSLYNEIEVEKSDRLIVKTDRGLPADGNNLVIRAMKYAWDAMGQPIVPVFLRQTNRIPSTSGLGSSAACIVGGIVAANELSGGKLTEAQVLDLATKMEGHPDNVASALYGGINASVLNNGHVDNFHVDAPDNFRLALLTPSKPLTTEKSRSVLPSQYSRADAVYNVSHAVATIAALLQGDPTRLSAALSDRMHEQYRLPLIDGAKDVLCQLKNSGAYASYLSGAGPTLAAFVPKEFDFKTPNGFCYRLCEVAAKGTIVTRR